MTADAAERWGGVDGVLHAIAFAPEDALGGKFMTAPRESASQAFQTSAFSLKALAAALAPLMSRGSSIVGLDFDASVAWPIYDWMGVAKAALESVSRYLARDLGPRGSASTWSRRGRSGRSPPAGSPGSSSSPSCGAAAPLGWDIGGPGAGRRRDLLPAVATTRAAITRRDRARRRRLPRGRAPPSEP